MKAGLMSLAAIGLLCLMIAPGAWAEEPTLPVVGYAIGPGDVLEVSVWKNPDLTRQVVVLPDGKITFPLLGELQAGGKTVAELTEEIRQRLTRYVSDVTLTVMITHVGSMQIYVIGKVQNPGRFPINTDVNVLQALAMAGGLNPFAKRDKIKIFRQQASGIDVFYFDYDEVAKDEDLSKTIRLKRGDVVLVP
jgi:polysaccharide export outer membrane protein